MLPVFDSLLAVFLVIATGWITRLTGLIQDQHWGGVEKVTYFIFFPALIIDTLARADLAAVPVLGVGGALIGAILTIACAMLLAQPWLARRISLDGPSFTSLFQGSTRWNTFVGLATATSLFGARGATLMAVAIAAMVPLLNTLATYVLIRYAGGPRQSPLQVAWTFATNPFIWSCAVGLALNLSGLTLPTPLAGFVDVLGRAALAAGLLIVGAGLDASRLARPRAVHLVSLAAKLFVLPLIAVALARLLGVAGDDLAVTVIAASVPTASGAYVFAKQMGGNAHLMAEIITFQTVAAFATMPLMLFLLAA
jgi:malonate transporter